MAEETAEEIFARLEREAAQSLASFPASQVDINGRQRWIWDEGDGEQHAPIPEFTIFTGMGDVGKTTVVCDRIALLTRGMLPGEFFGEPVRTLYIVQGEVGHGHAAKLLHAAGADLDYVRFEYKEQDGNEVLLSIPGDIPRLEEIIATHDLKLVAFDNIEAHVEEMTSPFAENSIRNRVVSPLTGMAHRSGVAVWAIKHPPKGERAHAHEMVGGSGAWVNAARSCFFTRRDPDVTDRKVYLLIHIKNNLGVRYSTTTEYVLAPSIGRPDIPVVRWGAHRPEVTDLNYNAASYRDGDEIRYEIQRAGHPLSPAEVAKSLEMNRNTVKQRMRRMADRGELHRAGEGKFGLP